MRVALPSWNGDQECLRQGERRESCLSATFTSVGRFPGVRFQVVPPSDQFPFVLTAHAATHSEYKAHKLRRFFYSILTLSGRVRIKLR
jgi:hypothetical protein